MSSTTVPGSPVVLYSNGIPIGPADLDFGNAATQQQLNALSSFSQMVNAIPSPGSVWVSSGSETWSIYKLVLSMAEFAQQAKAVAATVSSPQPEILTAAPAATTSSRRAATRFALANNNDAVPVIATFQQSIASSLRGAGFRFAGSPDELPVKTIDYESLATFESAAPDSTGLSSAFLDLKAQLSVDALTDTRGTVFYPTYVYPADFYASAYDASWKPFEITPGKDDPWAPVHSGGNIKGEMITVPLQRSWWSPWVFSSRGWRFSPASGLPQLSDGGSPPQGMMPLYASMMIIVRNIQVVAASDAAARSGAASPPFTLRDRGSESAPAGFEATAAADPSGMIIIGFGCTPLPKSPNPDPGLDWASG